MADLDNPTGQVGETITPDPTSEPTTSVEGEAQEQQQEQPKYVTKEELDGFAEEVLRRAKQSDRDRSKRIESELGKITTLLTKAGTQVTPEQEVKLRNQIIDEIDGPEQPEGQSAAPLAAPDPAAAVDNFLNGIFEEVGAKVTTNDPEWKELQKVLDDNFNNPAGLPKVIVAATKAAEAKRDRTASLQETAAARVGGSGSHATGTVLEGNGRQQLSQAFGSK